MTVLDIVISVKSKAHRATRCKQITFELHFPFPCKSPCHSNLTFEIKHGNTEKL